MMIGDTLLGFDILEKPIKGFVIHMGFFGRMPGEITYAIVCPYSEHVRNLYCELPGRMVLTEKTNLHLSYKK